MPRIENIGSNVSDWCEETGEGSSTADICRHCAKILKSDPHVFNDELDRYQGDPQGVDGWEAGCEHPEYSDCDYDCQICDKKLTDGDQ